MPTVCRGRWVGECRLFRVCGLVGNAFLAVGSAVVAAILINGGTGLIVGPWLMLVGRGIRAD